MQNSIAVDKHILQYLPQTIQAYCQTGSEAALFYMRVSQKTSKTFVPLPFPIVRSVGQWKGFICVETSQGYCFNGIGNDQLFVYTSKDFSVVDVDTTDLGLLQSERFFQEIVQYIYQVRLMYHDCLLIHAAAVIHNDCCIAFSGESGAGKSTQANLWIHYLGAEVVNYDKPGVLVGDTPILFGTPFGGKEHVVENAEKKLKAIVFVNQSKENRIVKLSGGNAFSKLYAHYMLYPINNEVSGQFEELISMLAASVPVYDLYCDISKEAVACTFEEVFQEPYIEKGRISLKIRDDYTIRNIAGEYVAFQRGKLAINATSTIVMNESSAFLWKKLQDNTTIEALIDALIDEYQIDYALAERDVKAFLQQLEENNLLVKGEQ